MDTLIRAAARLDNAWVWLVGDGSERSNLEDIAKDVGLSDRIRFVGWQKEPAHYLAASDIFCFPSRHEPFGNAGLEAWRLGLPLVSSRSQGPSWFMRDGENGLLVDIGDIVGFASAFKRRRDDPSLRQTLIDGGYRSLDTQFSKKIVTDQYLDLLSGNTERSKL